MEGGLPKGAIVELFLKFNCLTDSIKTILIEKGEYYPASNTDEDIEVLEIIIDSTNNAMSTKSYYKAGGNGAKYIIEYKDIETKRGIKFFCSSYHGTCAFTDQDQFEVYNFDIISKQFELLTDINKQKLFKVEIKDFFFYDTPDSIIQEYLSHSSNYFILLDCNNSIAKNILDDNLIFNKNKDNRWIRGEVIRFDLKGNKFSRSNPYYEFE